MDGKGYPRGLTRDQMSVQARVMGIADIFEALTAKDRPYKPGKTTRSNDTACYKNRYGLVIHGFQSTVFVHGLYWSNIIPVHVGTRCETDNA